ncbi:MAG: hypothetical protein EPO06_03160 [Burkholderiaceae bacterium]|nr:MAG: hypothetical protein EPO06_03160 [Burkholderiaceae bacterium]
MEIRRWMGVFLAAFWGLAGSIHAQSLDVPSAIINALKNKDQAALDQLIDIDAFSNVVLRGAKLPSSVAEAVKHGMAAGAMKLSHGLIQTAERAGTPKLMRVRSRGEKQYVLVRLAGDDASNYFEYIEFVVGGNQHIEDWSTLSRGGLTSDFLRLFFVGLLNKETLARLYAMDAKAGKESMQALQALNSALSRGDYAGAYEALAGFPEAYRKTRDWAMVRISMGMATSVEKYEEATQYLAENFGNDPTARALLINYYAVRKNWDAAYDAVEAVESIVGADGLLASQKARILSVAGKYREAIEVCRLGIQMEPDRKALYWDLVNIGLLTKDAPLVLSTLTTYEEAFGFRFDPDKLAKLGPYAEIAKTPDFAVWAQSRQQKN